MHRSTFRLRRLSVISEPGKKESRDSGKTFIAATGEVAFPPIETRCPASRFDRRRWDGDIRFYKYFAPTALAILITGGSCLFGVAQAQRRLTSSNAIPSPRSVLGFNPGDDRTIADWNQISDYFTRL